MPRINRRDFIRWGAGEVALLASGLPLKAEPAPLEKGKSVSRTTGRIRKSIPSACLMCPAGCGILGYLEYGKVERVGGNPLDPNSRGRLCAKGIAGINHLYNPDRVLAPLRRAGRRGEGRWKEIPWDEALKEVALRLQALQAEGRHHDFMIRNTWDLSSNDLAGRFASAFGGPTAFDHALLESPNGSAALQCIAGLEMGIGDIGRSRYILNFGGNPYESHFFYLPFIQRLVDARVNIGAKLVTFDVRISQTAGKSDEWFPIIPGTDGMVILSMAYVIANAGLWDKEFIERWTNASPSRLLRHLAPYTPKKAEASVASGPRISNASQRSLPRRNPASPSQEGAP